MNNIVYIKTDMTELPESCLECPIASCRLPAKKNVFEHQIKKVYKSKRHEDCPLKQFKED